MHDLITCAAHGLAQAAKAAATSWVVRQLGRLLLWGISLMAKTIEAETEYLTAAEAGERLGISGYQVTRTYERGFMPPARKLGRVRMIPVEDLPALKEAARKAGYLA